MTEALKNSGAHLIEPVMSVEINVVDEAAEQGVHGILQELGRRRGVVRGVTQQDTQGFVVFFILFNLEFVGKNILVEAKLPLAETTGLANVIRSISSGLGSLHMEFSEYEHVSPHDQAKIMENYYSKSRG